MRKTSKPREDVVTVTARETGADETRLNIKIEPPSGESWAAIGMEYAATRALAAAYEAGAGAVRAGCRTAPAAKPGDTYARASNAALVIEWVGDESSGERARVVLERRPGGRASRVTVHPHLTPEAAQAEADELCVSALVRPHAEDPRPYETRLAEARAEHARRRASAPPAPAGRGRR